MSKAMEGSNFIRKSQRQRRISTVLDDYVQDEIFSDDEFITLDEIVEEGSNSEGKHYICV